MRSCLIVGVILTAAFAWPATLPSSPLHLASNALPNACCAACTASCK
jgi:hypothetical protein